MPEPAFLQQFDLQTCTETEPADMALHRNRRTKTFGADGKLIGLNLCSCGVRDLAFLQLPDCQHLQALNVSENPGLTRIQIPAKLRHLRHLNVSENPNLTELHFEAGLPALETLLADQCQLRALRLPSGFAALQKLDCRQNQLTQVDFEEGCPALEFLDLSQNKLQGLRLPGAFPDLKYLYLNGNQLRSLVLETPAEKLEVLSLKNNDFQDWQPGQMEAFPGIKNLYLYGNPLPDTMRGFIENNEYETCLGFLEDYFRDMEKGRRLNNECKVLLIGNGNVGKSCLVERLVHDRFVESWDSTHAISLSQYECKGQLLNLWDFAGQDIYHATHRLFMQSNAVYLVLWDWQTEHSPHTERTEQGEIRQYENFPLSYWLDYAKNQGDGSPVIVVQTKTGRDGKKDCPDIRAAYSEQFCYLDFHHIESKEADRRKNGFNRLLDMVDEAIAARRAPTEIPENWTALRQQLRDLQQAHPPKKELDLGVYLEMAHALNLEDPIGVLENWLTKTGVVFYRRGLFHNKIILDQAWAIEAVYTLFDRERSHYFAFLHKKGVFVGNDLQKIWSDNSPEECELFLSFMLSCQICFETTPEKEQYQRHTPFAERSFVAPQMLDEQKPSAVRLVEEDWENTQLHIRYRHDFLHYGLIQSFIVRTHTHANVRDIWRHGILLKEGREYAVIEAIGKEIRVQVSPNGKTLLDKVRNLLESLQDRRGAEFVSTDGQNFVALEKLKKHPAQNPEIEAENGHWIPVAALQAFIGKDENNKFEEPKPAQPESFTDKLIHMQQLEKTVSPDQQGTATKKAKVFISYAHANDSRYLKTFVTLLRQFSDWEIFDDRLILIGQDWHERLQKEVRECDFAILLLSQPFFKSEYIREHEFEQFVSRSVQSGFPIFSVLLSDCDYGKWSEIARRQFFVAHGQDYDLAKSHRDAQITFDLLARYDRDGELIPNPYLNTFCKNFVAQAQIALQAKNG